jgi:hypothetical protein
MVKTAPSLQEQIDCTPSKPAEDALWMAVNRLQNEGVAAEVISLAMAKVFMTHARAMYDMDPWSRRSGWFLNFVSIAGYFFETSAKGMRAGWTKDIFAAVADAAKKFETKRSPPPDEFRATLFAEKLQEIAPLGHG